MMKKNKDNERVILTIDWSDKNVDKILYNYKLFRTRIKVQRRNRKI